MNGNWGQSKPDWVSFCKKLEVLKFTKIPDEKLVKPYFDSIVEPYRKMLIHSSTRDDFSRVKLSDDEFFKITALCAYFPGTAYYYSVPIDRMLEVMPSPNNYEFSKVALTAYSVNGRWVFAMGAITQKLLAKDRRDPLTRLTACPNARTCTPLWKMFREQAMKMSEEMLNEYPGRMDMMLPMTCMVYRRAYMDLKSQVVFDKFLGHVDHLLKRFPNTAAGELLRKERPIIIQSAYKAGLKVPAGT